MRSLHCCAPVIGSRWRAGSLDFRQYNDWASQFNVDVRKLLAVFEADFVTLARSVHNAEHANSGLGRLAPGGPTARALRSTTNPVLLRRRARRRRARSLFFVMELVADEHASSRCRSLHNSALLMRSSIIDSALSVQRAWWARRWPSVDCVTWRTCRSRWRSVRAR
jgi:hypothetical protein